MSYPHLCTCIRKARVSRCYDCLMKKQTLHELAKFFSGLVLADFIVALWVLSQGGMFPVSFFGAPVDMSMMAPWILFDIGLFLILVHYGWHWGKSPILRERTYLLVAAVVFGIVALAHLYRSFAGTDLILAGWVVPTWLSWIGTIVSAYLSYMSAHLALRIRH